MRAKRTQLRGWIWTAWLIAAFFSLEFLDGPLYGILVPLSALLLALIVREKAPTVIRRVDWVDLAVIIGLYLGVVGLFRLAFVGFTTANVLGLFLSFAGGLLLGVIGPVVYTVWIRHRTLADLGLTLANWRPAVGLGLLLAGVQFALTLWGYRMPEPVDWVPLLVMSLVVGLFEAVFFRGFLQGRLQASVGRIAGVGIAAAMYSLYHVGYGMEGEEMIFLFGLGVVYGIAYALVRNILVLWPLLTPMGSLFNNLQGGDIDLPWASIAGFADVLAVMGLAVWLAHRRQVRHPAEEVG